MLIDPEHVLLLLTIVNYKISLLFMMPQEII